MEATRGRRHDPCQQLYIWMWNRLQNRQINVTNVLHASFEMSWDVRTGSLEADMSCLSVCLSVTTHRSSHSLTFVQDLASRTRLRIKFSLLCGERNKNKHWLKRYKKMKAFHTFGSEFSSTLQTKTLGHIPCIHSELQSSEVCIPFIYRQHLAHCWQQERNTNGDRKGMHIYF